MKQINIIILVLLCLALIGLITVSLSGNKSIQSSSAPCTSCSEVSLPIEPLQSLGNNYDLTKRALLFGCNYNFPGSACLANGCVLNGCIEDVNNIKLVLQSKAHFSPQYIEVYVDDGSTIMPTKSFMIQQLQNIVAQSLEGDSIFIWYSGHGAQLYNATSDGGFDECWCPPDTIRSGDYLRDTELNSIIKNAKCSVFIGSDSCHSGTIFDLPFIIQESSGANANRNLGKVLGKKSIEIKNTFAKRAQNLSPISAPQRSLNNLVVIRDASFPILNSLIVTLSGCQDFDTSADGYEDGEAQGAMTWSFLNTYTPLMTFSDLLMGMRSLLKSRGYWQVPQMSMSQLINPNTSQLISMGL